MGYIPMGDLDASDWNSTKYPGVCKPTNFGALAKFKELQTQLNRVAQAKGLGKIGVDGDIGAGTVNLLRSIVTASAADRGASSTGTYATVVYSFASSMATSCSSIAAKADVLAAALKNYANALGVSSAVSSPAPPKPSSIITSSGEVTAPPEYQGSGSGPIGAMTAGQKVFAGLALGGLAYAMLGKKKRGAAKRRYY
jgi:hypothetical protein